MYRDPLKVAKAHYDKAKDALEEPAKRVEEHGSHVEDLPDKLREELEELRRKIEPSEETAEGYRRAEQAVGEYTDKLMKAADLLAQLKFQREVGIIPSEKRWKVWGRRFGVLGAIIAAPSALIYGPGALVEHADDAGYECRQEKRRLGEPEAGDCRQSMFLWPARLFPWVRDKARERDEHDARAGASQDLIAASRGALDGAARDEAARRVIEVESTREAADKLFDAGAFEVLANAPKLAETPEAYVAAVLIGDVERAAALRPLEITSQHAGFESGQARRAMLLDVETGWQKGRVRSAGMSMLRNSPLSDESGQRQWLALAVAGDPPLSSRTLGQAFDARARTDFHVIGEAMPLSSRGLTAWSIQQLDDHVVLPEQVMKAGEALVRLKVPEPSSDPDGYLDPDEWVRVYGDTLKTRVAWAFFIDAAIEYTKRGNKKGALEAIANADKVAPAPFKWIAAPVQHAFGDAKTAADRYAAALARDDFGKMEPGDRRLLRISSALAQLSLGQYGPAFELVEKTSVDDRDGDGAIGPGEVQWMMAATAMLANRRTYQLDAAPASIAQLDRAGSEYFDAIGPATWKAIAEMADDERRRIRVITAFNSISPGANHALPALFYVIGQAAGGGDTEVWLDAVMGTMLDDHLNRASVLMVAAARAEAARWRGDEAAAAKWNERLARLRSQLTNARAVRAAVLAGW